MTSFDYRECPYPVRQDIAEAHRAYWDQLARPGNWWTGRERIAIASEVRLALNCDYCQRRKTALSPYQLAGEHANTGALAPNVVDAVHRITTDQNRITRSWIEQNVQAGLAVPAYVELAGIVVCVLSIDEFHRALGMPYEQLPEPVSGAPDHYQPQHLESETGFVPMVSRDGAIGPEADLWSANRSANVLRALSLVPDAVRAWARLSAAQYLSFQEMGNFDQPANRALNRMQIELVAGRVSSHNECFY